MLNLTPYDIVLKDIDGRRLTIPLSGQVAKIVGVIVPYTRHFGKIIGLPHEDEPCIVSSLVLEAVRIMQPSRRHVYAPSTKSNVTSDEVENIIGIRQIMYA